jgi:branched-chain amino acid transport system permease protein
VTSRDDEGDGSGQAQTATGSADAGRQDAANPTVLGERKNGGPVLKAPSRRGREGVFALAACVVVVVAPYLSGNLYYRVVAVQVFIYIALAVSYQVLFGYARLVSFGHAAFYGVSAYVSAVLIAKYDVPHVLAWVAGILLAMLVALIAGRVIIRLEPLLLAVATLAFAQIVVLIVSQLTEVTGGLNGLVTSPLILDGVPVPEFNYWFVSIGMLLVVGAAVALVRSPVGRLLLAVGDDPVAARSLGANPTRVLVFAFVVSSGLAGVAGVLLTQSTSVLAPEIIGLDTSILILAMIAVGGLRSISGAVLGAVILSLIPVVFASLQQGATLLYGALILIVFMVSPEGLMGLRKVVANRSWGRKR